MFFDISRYLRDKYFDIVWGCHPPGTPKNQFFEWLQLEFYFFFDISRYITEKYFDIVWGCPPPPPGDPQMDPTKINFLNSSTWVPVCFDIRRYLTNNNFDIVWGYHPPREPQIDPQKSIFEQLKLGCQCFIHRWAS